MKKLFLLPVLLFVVTSSYAQTLILTDQNAEQEITALFQRAKQAQYHEIITRQVKYDLSTNYFAMDSETFSHFNLSSKHPVASTKRPWQLALIMATETRKIDETLNELRAQIQNKNLSQAVLLDITRLPQQSAGKSTVKKGKGVKGKSVKGKSGSTSRQEAELFFLFLENGKAITEKRTLAMSINATGLIQAVLKQLNTNTPTHYTGIYMHAHSDGTYVDTNTKDFLSLKDIAQLINQQKLKVDFLGLATCHTSSLESIYALANSSTIQYVSSSSDGEYAPSTFYRFLRHLNKDPLGLATSFTETWRQEIQWSPIYDTTNMNTLQLSSLKNPLKNYVKLYDELQGYEGEESEEIHAKFRALFSDFYYDWKSLSVQITKQRDYITSRIAKDQAAWALADTERKFVAACNTLLGALKKATLTQWCYSNPHNRIYTGNYPAGSGCLSSVNVTADQYYNLTDFSAAQ